MLLDFLCTAELEQYNVQLAQKLGLNCAVYLQQLLNINKKAISKKRVNAEGFFNVDRNYVAARTTFTSAEQHELDQKLANVNIVSVGKTKENIKIDVEVLASICVYSDEKIDKTLLDVVKKPARKTKTDLLKEELKATLLATMLEFNQPQTLHAAYCDWIDAVVSKLGWMSKSAVRSGVQLITSICCPDINYATAVITAGAVNGYRDMNWALETFKEQNPRYRKVDASSDSESTTVTVSDEVF